MVKFVDSFFDREQRFSLGVEEESATPYLSIPVSSNVADYEEYYALSDDEYACFGRDHAAARRFADQCRDRERDDRLIRKPGWNRGEPR